MQGTQVRHVVHNWPDASCLVILKNIRQAMNADSRLFIRGLTKIYVGPHI
jgi:hypothetical protein